MAHVLSTCPSLAADRNTFSWSVGAFYASKLSGAPAGGWPTLLLSPHTDLAVLGMWSCMARQYWRHWSEFKILHECVKQALFLMFSPPGMAGARYGQASPYGPFVTDLRSKSPGARRDLYCS